MAKRCEEYEQQERQQAMATAIVEHRRTIALLARAIELAQAGAPFADFFTC